MANERKDIRILTQRYAKLQTLMCRITEEALKEEHRKQEKGKAVGVDKVTKEAFGEKLDENVKDLIQRMKRMQYKPQPVKRTYIPKGNGKMRPLGIPAYEDRLVQGCMANILKEIYEPKFLDCSYGFREKRSAHTAIHKINELIGKRKVNYVLDCDIKGFFDNVNQEWLIKFLSHDIADKRFIRYIVRFLKSGIMEENKRYSSDMGTPQGGLISPILANVYLHYVLDLWFKIRMEPKMKGEAYLVRYADDFLVLFQYENEAKLFYTELIKRMEKFGLELSEEKTRIVPFGRFNGGKEMFEFLGFIHYGAKTQKGKYRVGHLISRKKLKVKRLNIKTWVKANIRMKIPELLTKLNIKLTGTCRYYGINGMIREVSKLFWYAQNVCFKRINRRSQRKSYTVTEFSKIWWKYITPPKIYVNIW